MLTANDADDVMASRDRARDRAAAGARAHRVSRRVSTARPRRKPRELAADQLTPVRGAETGRDCWRASRRRAQAAAARRPRRQAVGGRARRSARSASSTAFPALVTYKAKGVVPDDHPWFGGVFTNAAIERPLIDESDLLIGIGLDPVELLPRPWTWRQPVVSVRVRGAFETRMCRLPRSTSRRVAVGARRDRPLAASVGLAAETRSRRHRGRAAPAASTSTRAGLTAQRVVRARGRAAGRPTPA